MSQTTTPYLCGGTFLTQILRARPKLATATEHTKQHKEKLSEQETFRRLISIYHMNDFPVCSSLKTYTSKYKTCIDSLESFALFSDNDMKRAFDEDVRSHNSLTLSMMSDFVQEFIEPQKYNLLLRCLLDMVKSDVTITPDAVFYISDDLVSVTKEKLILMESFVIERFLLGMWHFIIMNRSSCNEKGAATYKEWYPNKRKYVGKIGNGITHQIFVKSVKYVKEELSEKQEVKESGIIENKEQKKESPVSNIVLETFDKISQQAEEKNATNNLKIDSNVIIAAPQLLTPEENSIFLSLNNEYYNLFVSGDIDLQNIQPFMMDMERVLTEYIDEDIKKTFSSLSDDIQEEIKTFPTIFANENMHYKYAGEDQVLGLGYIHKIKVRHDAVKIYPQIIYLLPQQRLNEAAFELDMSGRSRFNEFSRSHWSIKRVDLIAELRELGFQM